MTTKYLLPCSCGDKIAVESTQAGQILRCSCGKPLEVPTLQGIRRLERSVDESDQLEAPSSYGGVAIGVALVGLVIALGGAGFTGWLHQRQPVLIDIDYMSPWDTWLMWHSLRDGVRMPEYANSPYQEAKKIHNQYMTVGIVITVIGILTLACSVMIFLLNRRSQQQRTSPRAPS